MKNSWKATCIAVIAGIVAAGCTVVEDPTPDKTVITPPDKDTNVTITPPAGGGSVSTTGN